MLMDFYELTMANGYLKNGVQNTVTYFDMFFRDIPDGGGFAIMAGTEQLCQYLENLRFTDEDVEFLRGKGVFSEDFLEYLRNFRFTCDVWAVPEGSPIFPGEPIVTVRGPIIECQLIETMLLLTVNHQSLIATKASRMVRAAGGRAVLEFGSRRAQGADGALLGARAAYIAGCAGTACVLADQQYGVPAAGTMAHCWVQLFDSEYEAFAAYANAYPQNCSLLIDTYNVLKSGLPNAIRVAKEILEPQGHRLKSIRIDSGDIAYLTKKIRAELDANGMQDCKIIVSNSIDEFLIREMLMQGAEIDTFGIGERLITSRSNPVFGGVYKLAAIERDGRIIPRIKISENVDKITTPHFKMLYRLMDRSSGKYMADLITLWDEKIDDTEPLTIFDPAHTWKRKTVENFVAVPMLKPLFEGGKCVHPRVGVEEIRKYCAESVDRLWPEVTRFEYPHRYYVDLSQKLWDVKQELLSGGGKTEQ